jgi:hypothetical protein
MERFRPLLPHAIALAALLLIAMIIGKAELFDGMELRAHDDDMWRGAAMQAMDFEKENGRPPLWTNRMFSGMPNYLIYFKPVGNFISPTINALVGLGLSRVAMYLWTAMAGFYLMMVAFKTRPEAAAISAVAFGLTSYVAVVLAAGHFGKVQTIGYLPWAIAGMGWVARKKYLAGAAMTGIMMSCTILAGHYQMIYYYMVFFVALWLIQQAFISLKTREIKHIAISASLLALAMGAALIANLNQILPVLEYQKFSTRAPSELTTTSESVDPNEETGGLQRSYITGYSYAKGDLMALMIPNYKGPKNGLLLLNETAEKSVGTQGLEPIRNFQIQAQQQGLNVYIDQYWGYQDAAGGVIYAGVLVFVLGLFGLFFVRSELKWVILTGLVLTMWLALGKNAPWLTNLFIDYFPGYNKFRAVNSIMVIPQFLLPLLFGLTLNEILESPNRLKEPFKVGKKEFNFSYEKFGYGIFIAALGFMALSYVAPSLFQDIVRAEDADQISRLAGNSAGQIIDAMEKGREAILRSDLGRSILFLLLGAAILWAFLKQKLNALQATIALGLVVAIDLGGVGARYLDKSAYQPVKPKNQAQPQTAADRVILNDGNPSIRVLNLAVSPFNDATTSFYHQSIGGYHGAKMKRYQEFIESRIDQDLKLMRIGMQGAKTIFDAQKAFVGCAGLNMLNTKYIIVDPKGSPIENPYHYGHAWFPRNIEFVKGPDEELQSVKSAFNLKDVAFVDQKFKPAVKFWKREFDSTATVEIEVYKPEEIVYTVKSKVYQPLIFSELFYDKGWKVEMDGLPIASYRANYLLRAIEAAPGTHTIRWYFKPDVIESSSRYSYAGSAILALLLLGALVGWFRQSRAAKG